MRALKIYTGGQRMRLTHSYESGYLANLNLGDPEHPR